VTRFDPARAVSALNDALSAHDDDRIADALVTGAWPLLNHHFHAFRSALSELPISVVGRHYPLELYHPLTALIYRGPPGASEVDVRRLNEDEVGFHNFIRLLAARAVGDQESIHGQANRLAQWTSAQARTSQDAFEGPIPYYFVQLGFTALLGNDIHHALRQFALARSLAAHSTLHDSGRHAAALTGLAHTLRGAVTEARIALDSAAAHPIIAPDLYRIGAESSERAARALFAVETNAADADSLIAALAPLEAPDENWVFTLLARTRHALMQRRPTDARELITIAESSQRIPAGGLAADVVFSQHVEALIAAGQTGAAAQFIAQQESHKGALSQLAMLRLEVITGRRTQATTRAGALLASRDTLLGTRIEVLALLAWADYVAGAGVDPVSASQIAGYVSQGGRRVLLALPQDVIEALGDTLGDTERAFFRGLAAGSSVRPSVGGPLLSDAELRVLRLFATTSSKDEIARALQLSPHTVKTHLASIYRKLGTSTRAAALATAAIQGLLVEATE